MSRELEHKNILIVDNDKENRAVIKKTLQTHGFDVRTFNQGDNLLTLVDTYRPAVIICNLLNETERLEQIKSLPHNRRPSIIVLSNSDNTQDLADALHEGIDDFVRKPVDSRELVARIRAQTKVRNFLSERRRMEREQKLLLDIAQAITESLDRQRILRTIVDKLAAFSGAKRCSIVIIDKNERGYVVTSSDNPDLRELEIDINKYPEIKEVLKTKKHLIIDDISTHNLFTEVKDLVKRLSHTSLFILPIACEDDQIGTMLLRTHRDNEPRYTAEELEVYQKIADIVYEPLKNAQIFEKIKIEKEHLKVLSITDQLTGIYNHEFFYKRLNDELDRAKRYGLPLSLIMIDLDNFKSVNDSFGHRTGDSVLREVSGILKSAARKTDILARYGGEEFSIILTHTDLEGAKIEAERIKDAIQNHKYSGINGLPLTASIGVTSYSEEKQPFTSSVMVDIADTALYKAKRSGKNNIVAIGSK